MLTSEQFWELGVLAFIAALFGAMWEPAGWLVFSSLLYRAFRMWQKRGS